MFVSFRIAEIIQLEKTVRNACLVTKVIQPIIYHVDTKEDPIHLVTVILEALSPISVTVVYASVRYVSLNSPYLTTNPNA